MAAQNAFSALLSSESESEGEEEEEERSRAPTRGLGRKRPVVVPGAEDDATLQRGRGRLEEGSNIADLPARAQKLAQPASAEFRAALFQEEDEDADDADQDCEEGLDLLSMTTKELRTARGVSLQLASEREGLAAEACAPVIHFADLASLGVAETLVSACQRSVGGHRLTTPIQAECWGMMLVPDGEPMPRSGGGGVGIALASSVRTQDAPPTTLASHLDVPLPDSSDDEEKIESARVLGDTMTPPLQELAQAADGSPAAVCRVRVREDLDIIGIAPTGSGKTLAFLVPILADVQCDKRKPASFSDIFGRFSELFSYSFPCDSEQNASVLQRLQRMRDSGETTALRKAVTLVSTKALSCDSKKSPEWQTLFQDLEALGLVEPTAVVLSPTRELAQQVGEVARQLDASCAVILGGVDHEQQRTRILEERPALLVATPGRLLALCGQWPPSSRLRRKPDEAPPEAAVELRHVRRLVLDEGDRLLEEGFEEDIRALCRLARFRRQTMMFSATWAARTESLAGMLRPTQVRITVAGVPPTICQQVELVPKAARGKRLREVLQNDLGPGSKVLLFVIFKKEARELAKMLVSEGFQAFALQGNMSQAARTQAMQGFRDHAAATKGGAKGPVMLVATDVAARGLDVPDISHVVNFSLGLSFESYVHRIGRCGRAGRSGRAITFVTDGDEKHSPQLWRLLKASRQRVPPGLADMATRFESSGGRERLSVQWGAAGEAKVVSRG